ncbi:carbohydrate ABC transporter permease, partial [Salmonella enterica subsp. enterica]|nr:carbohydrate ABC transporter permease [Salmonella enterica subsp. enterica]
MDTNSPGASLRIIRFLVLAVAVIAMVFPIYWMVVASFRSPETLYSDVWPFPREPSIRNYQLINNFINYNTQYVNSIIVSVSVMVVTMFISTFVAYSIARFRFRGRGLLTIALLFSYMFPPLLTLIPLYVIFVHLGIAGSLLSLIIAELAITLP